MKTHRRSVLKSMLSIPLFARGWMLSPAKTSPKTPPPCGSRQLGLVRRLNTLQYRFKAESAVYGEHSELLEAALNRMSTDGYSREALRLALSADSVPGWSLSIRLSALRDAYLLALTTVEQIQPNTIASDEKGVIYFGTVPRTEFPPGTYTPLNEAFIGLSPLQASKPTTTQKMTAWAREIVFSGIGGEVRPDTSCQCFGTCRTQGQLLCCNVGSLSCPWCCYPGCEECSLICWSYCDAGCAGC